MSKKGYSVIPIDKDKNPIGVNWGKWANKPMTEEEVRKYFKQSVPGIALLMGGEKGLTAIDFDLKYSLDEYLYEKVLEQVPTSIYKKCMVQKTRSGGYHWVFSCKNGVGNVKLAQRPTTDDEIKATLQYELDSGKEIREAMKSAINDKVRVLIETRSFKSFTDMKGVTTNKADGYVLIPPSDGYEHVEGKVQEITPKELEQLLTALRSFNEYFPPKINLNTSNSLGGSFWDKMDEQLDTLEMLKECGWRVIYEAGNDVRLLRPGQVHSSTSGIYHKDTKMFVCFSTSTVFEPNKGYRPSMVYIELEGDGDIKTAREKLEQMLT